jgi:hypothetical protein
VVVALDEENVGGTGASSGQRGRETRRPAPTTSTSATAWTGIDRAGSVTLSARGGGPGMNASSSSSAAAVDIDAVPR